MALAVSALVVFAIEATKAFLRATMKGSVARRSEVPVSSAPVVSLARHRASLASVSQQFGGGNIMLKILVPVDGSRNCQFAVKHVIKEFMNNTAMEIHLLNVQTPFNRDIAQFFSGKTLHDYHHEQAQEVLAPIKQMLDGFSIPYAAHVEVGERAKAITDTARRLRCDHIVMSTARKNSLTRLVENSVTNRVLELTSVPVEVIAGDSVSKWERYGIPAAIGAVLALTVAAVD
jgi:nucleotide-binding universal stress UspA family protein